MPILTTAVQHHTIRQEEKIKGIHFGKEDLKLSLSDEDMILDLETCKSSTRKPLDLINK